TRCLSDWSSDVCSSDLTSCVQIELSAVKVSCAVRATRRLPELVCTSAALPTDERGELASMVNWIVLPVPRVPLTLDTAGTLSADVGLPPLPSRSDATLTIETT